MQEPTKLQDGDLVILTGWPTFEGTIWRVIPLPAKYVPYCGHRLPGSEEFVAHGVVRKVVGVPICYGKVLVTNSGNGELGTSFSLLARDHLIYDRRQRTFRYLGYSTLTSYRDGTVLTRNNVRLLG